MYVKLLSSSWRHGWLQGIATLLLLVGQMHAAQAMQSSLVLDASSGRVLSETHADEVDHPASLTKMMTIYLTFQALQARRLTLDQKLPVSAHAAAMAPTKLGLRAGQTISVRDCILGMVTKSANDAATVVAEKLGGSEGHFVEMMNAQGLLLGMGRTHFASASGLPKPDDATTARDMSRLAIALYRDFPGRAPLFATREFMFRGKLVRGHNHLMDRYEGMDGLKTGYTAAAGFNLASTAVRNGHRLFGVVLGEDSARVRDDRMAQLLDDGFEQSQGASTLVAETGRPRTASKVLAALSPIGTAEAEAVASPVAPHRRSHRHAATRRMTATTKKAAAAPHGRRHRNAGTRLAKASVKPPNCSARKSARACVLHVRAHGTHAAARLAHREVRTTRTRGARQRD